MRFADLIQPLTPSDFFRDYATRQALLVSGNPDKFQSLFEWDSLNRILAQHRLEPPRCRVEKQGAVPGDLTIVDYVPSPRGLLVPRVNPDLLYKRLCDGATLVVDAINEADDRVDALAVDVAAVFSSRPQTNLYASFGETPGFGVHWDSRDVFAVQVSGRKHWTVYYPTREAPLYRDFHDRSSRPTKIWWQGILEAGSVLYVPRGWWHEVTSIAEPSMHLTVGADPVTGLDYLLWLNDQLREQTLWRHELPRFDGNLEEHLELLLTSLMTAVGSHDLKAFLRDRSETRAQRSRYALPYAIPTCDWPIPADKTVRKVTPSLPYYIIDDRIVLRANGKEIELAEAAEPLLRILASRDGVSILALAEESSLPADDVRSVVTALVGANVLYVT